MIADHPEMAIKEVIQHVGLACLLGEANGAVLILFGICDSLIQLLLHV